MNYLRLAAASAAAMLLSAGAAQAQDRDSCKPDTVCASNVQSVADAMKKAGYDVKITQDDAGDPLIESEAGYGFDVFFYGCEQHKNCDSLRFEVSFRKEPENTNELANKWNANKRFLQMSVKPSGQLNVAYDLATIGGVNQRNFGDVLDWWSSMLQELGKFFDENVPAKDAPPATGAKPATTKK